MYAGDEQLFAALEAGASAFVAKDAPSDDVVAAARHATVSPRSFTAANLADAMRRRMTPTGPQLSPREHEVLRLLAEGLGRRRDRPSAVRQRVDGQDAHLQDLREAWCRQPRPGDHERHPRRAVVRRVLALDVEIGQMARLGYQAPLRDQSKQDSAIKAVFPMHAAPVLPPMLDVRSSRGATAGTHTLGDTIMLQFIQRSSTVATTRRAPRPWSTACWSPRSPPHRPDRLRHRRVREGRLHRHLHRHQGQLRGRGHAAAELLVHS